MSEREEVEWDSQVAASRKFNAGRTYEKNRAKVRTEGSIDAALTAWFANTKHGWKAAMKAALEAADK